MRSIFKQIKNIFNKIGQVLALVFIWLYKVIIFLIDNTIGLLFTKELRSINKKYSKEYLVWKKTKFILLILSILAFVIYFINIYNLTLAPIFELLMNSIGKLISSNSTYHKVLTTYSRSFSEGIGTTLYLSLVGTVIGFLLALVFSAIVTTRVHPKDSKIRKFFKNLGKTLVNLYTSIIRGTPMMVQAMILYWGVRGFLNWDYLTAGLVTVTINTAAYLTEVMRGSILSLDKGQYEAGLSLGLTPWQTMTYIIYPQAIKNAMASIGNEFVINIKDTAVLSVILVVDIFRVAELANARYFDAFPPFIIAALIYLLLTTTVTAILRKIEEKLDIPTSSLPSAN